MRGVWREELWREKSDLGSIPWIDTEYHRSPLRKFWIFWGGSRPQNRSLSSGNLGLSRNDDYFLNFVNDTDRQSSANFSQVSYVGDRFCHSPNL